MEFFERNIFRSDNEATTKKTKIVSETERLKWTPVAFQTIQQKFKFLIFSKRDGSIAKYFIGSKAPDFLWTELKNKPMNITFEQTETKYKKGCRLLRDGIPQNGAEIWIDKE